MKNAKIWAFLIIIIKSSKWVKVWKLLKVLKYTKPLITIITMLFSVFAYSFLYSPWFSAGLVLMLLIHEVGHVAAFRLIGYKASAPVFIPMIGAVVFGPKTDNPDHEAIISFGGPLLGGLAALALFGIWMVLPDKSDLILLISFSAVILNIFNLLPIRPLDGGGITQAIGGWFKYIGLGCLLLITYYVKEPGIILIWILVLSDSDIAPWRRFGFGLILELSMIWLLLTGYSNQDLIMSIADVVIATAINAYLFLEAWHNTPEVESTSAVVVVRDGRLKWFVRYFLLLFSLILLGIYHLPYLSNEAMNSIG